MKALIVHNPKNYRRISYGEAAKPRLQPQRQPLFFGWLTGIEIRSSPSSPLKPTVLILTAHLANMTATPIAYQTWCHVRFGGQQVVSHVLGALEGERTGRKRRPTQTSGKYVSSTCKCTAELGRGVMLHF